MIPVLFKGNETNFNHNGIGLLKDTLSCEVTEVGNGSFDLELVYPITGPYFKDLKNGNIIQAKPNDTDQPHNFRINEIDKTLSDKEIVVYAVSITNDLGGNMVKSLYLADVTPQVILNEMKNTLHYPTTFNFVSNITTVGTVDWSLNNPLNLIVGEEGSLVDIFGGEVKRANDTIFLYGRRGKDNVTTIRAGKNLDGFKMTESFQGKYTQILPYFKYEEEVPGEIAGDTEGETVRKEVTVFGSIVSSPYHGRYPVNAIKPIDFSQNELVRESKSLDSLNSVASKYFSNLYYEIDKPSVSINVDMVQLVDSEQYELYERLEKVDLTDTVAVYVPEYNVDILVKINELKYDSLRERTISIVAGSSGRTSLMDEISGSYKKFTTTLVDDKIQSATSGIINQILTQKNGSNIYAGRATPPDNSKPGDIWFKDTGGGDVELYEFDGVNWVRKMYKGFGDDVRQLVDSKIAEANVTITEALEEHDNTIAQAMTNAGQANDLAQQAKTEAENASLSASAANQDAQKAITDAANAKTEALAQVSIVSQALDTAKTNLQNQVSVADSKAVKAQTDADGLKVKTDTIKNDLDTAKTNLQNQVSAADSKAVQAQADADSLRIDLNQQAQTILDQAQAQTALTNRVTTVETLADGTKTTVAELSKTVDKATGDITSVTNRTKVVEDGLAGVKTNYTQLSQTVNTQTGQIDSINRKTADLQSGISGVTERFESLQVGNKNYLPTSRVVNRECTNFRYNETSKSWSMTVPTGSTTRFGYGITFNTSDLNILLNVNETLFFGLMIKANKACSFNYDINNYLSGSTSNDNDDRSKQAWSPSNKSLSANVWTRVWFSYTAKANVPITESNSNFCIVNNTEAVDIEIKEVIVAKSKVPVDYQSPDEDIAQQIAEYKRTSDQNYSGLQSTVSTLDGKVTQNKTEVNQTTTQLSNRLTSVEAYKDSESTRSQAYFEASKTETARQITAERTAISANYVAKSTYDENVSGTTLKLNEVKTAADTTKQNLATYQDTVNRKLTELTTSDQTLDGKITAASTKVDTVAGRIRTEISTVEGKIPTAIGATNYIRDFGFANSYTFNQHTSGWQFQRIEDSTARSGYHIKATCTIKGSNGFHRVLRDLRGTEWQGRKMTYSIDVKASKSVRIRLGVEAFDKGYTAFDVTTDWKRFVSTDTVNFKTWYSFPFYADTITWAVGDVVYIRDPQLEDGNIATTPRAAEEDLKTDITSIKTSITQTASGVEQLSTSLATTDGKVTTAETKISQLIGDVSSKVSQTDYNTLNGRVTNAESNISQQATQIASKVSQTDFNTEKTKISNLQTSVNQQAGQIALKANQTELDNLTGRMSTAESSITQVPNKIALAVEEVNAKIPQTASNINVATGSSNAWNDFDNITKINNWVKSIAKITYGDKTGIYANSKVNLLVYISADDIVLGNTVTPRITFQGPAPKRSDGLDAWGTPYNPFHNAWQTPLKSGNNYHVIKLSKTITADMYANFTGLEFQIRIDGASSGKFHWRALMITTGDVFPDYWVKPVEDIIQDVSSVKTSIDQTSRDIALKANATDLNLVTNRLSTTEGKITTQAGQIALKAEKTYVDTVKQTVDSTTSRVTLTEQSITSLVTGAKILPDGRTSAFATKIESLEGAINQRVTTQELNEKGYQTATDVTNKLAGYVTNQTYTTYTTNRQQTDTQITEQINQTVSKVPTGPVNLIVNGFDPQTVAPWKIWGTKWTLELTTHEFFYNGTKKLLRFKTSTATTKETFESNVYNLKRNTKYTIRVGIFANSNSKELRFCFGRGTSPSITDYSQAHPWFVGSTTKLEYKTITVDSGNFDYGKLTFDHNGAKTEGQWAEMYIAEISIIEGEYNNSWTPSFDELITEQKFNETKSTVDAFSRAIGTRDESGVVPNIARLVMTQDAVISEVAKYGEHTSNLIVDAANHSQTVSIGDASLTKYPQYDRIDFSRSGATTNVWAGFECKVNNTRFRTGEKYTVSFEYYLHSAPDADFEIELTDGGTWLSGIHFATTSTATGKWYKFQHTLTMYRDSIPNSNNIRFRAWTYKNGSVAIQKLMLVRGEKIGPYSPSQVDSVTTRVEQTANSYSIKFLNNANDITTQLNLTNSGVRIKSSLIHLDGNVTVSGTAWMDGAIIKNLSADKITTGTLNANNVNITNLSVDDVSGIDATFLKSVIGTAFIDWMKGKMITAMNGNMSIDLNNAKITFNADATINFNSDSNALVRKKGDVTAFVNFADDLVSGGVYAGFGVTSHSVGVTTASNSDSGKFAGMRVYRPNDNLDLLRLIGDTIELRHGTEGRYFYFTPSQLRNDVDIVKLAGAVYTLSMIFIHLRANGWSFSHPSFISGVRGEMARNWLDDFVIGGLPR